MTRISTYASYQLAQHELLHTREEADKIFHQTQSFKRASTFNDLGVDTGRALNAHTLLDQITSQRWVNNTVKTGVDLYANRLADLGTTMENFRIELLKAASTGDAPTVNQEISDAFDSLRTALNSQDDGKKMFAGANTDEDAFIPKSLDELASLDDADLGKAFGNDQVRRSGRISDDSDFTYGILASDLGTDFLKALKDLHSLGALPARLSDTQVEQLKELAARVQKGLDQLRLVEAANGVRQNRVDAIETRAADRARIITGVVSNLEDADVAQASTALVAHQTMMQISMAAYKDWSQLSLATFLR